MSMPDDPAPQHAARRRGRSWGRQKIGHINLDQPPSAQEKADHAARHKGEDADRFPLYNAEQVEKETKDVKLRIVFDEPIRIRDQAEMVIAAMEEIIETTKKHDLGSINQRIHSRHVAGVLGRALTRFNGGTPYGEYRKKD